MEPDAQLAPRVLLAVADPLLRRVASSALRARGYSVSATTEEEAALSYVADIVAQEVEDQRVLARAIYGKPSALVRPL